MMMAYKDMPTNMTEMAEIPEGWAKESFSNCLQRVKFERKKQFKENDYAQLGVYPIIDQGQSLRAGFTNDESRVILDIQPFIVFGDHTRIFKYISFPAALGADGIKIIKPKNDFDAKFFFYFLKNLQIPNRGYNRHYGVLKEKIILRPPLSEQKAIARILTTVQEAIAGQEALIDKLKELKKSMMHYLFTHGTKGEKTKMTEIGEIPGSWAVVELGSVCKEKIVDGVHETPEYVSEGIPFVSAQDIVNGKISYDKCKYISEAAHQFLAKRAKPQENDILLTKVGTVGNLAIVERLANFSIFVQLALIKPNEKVNRKFIFFFLQSDNMQKIITNNCAQSTMKFIGTQKIAKLPIANPLLKEQAAIVTVFETIDSKIEMARAKFIFYQDLFKTLLHELMSGERRVM